MRKAFSVLILSIILIASVSVAGFWYFRKNKAEPEIFKNDRSKIIYQTNNFDQYGALISADYHSINLNGTDDRIIYSKTDRNEYAVILNHSDIAIGKSMNSNVLSNKFFDKNGNNIEEKYKNINIDVGKALYDSPILSPDKNEMVIIDNPQQDIPEIRIFNFKTRQFKKYQCVECKNYQDYRAEGFSRDGTKLYFSVLRDPSPITRDAEPNEKYLFLDLENGTVNNLNIKYESGIHYDIYPQYDAVLKIKNATYFNPGSIDLMDLNDFSTKNLVNDLSSQGGPIFNGKDIVYNVFLGKDHQDYQMQEVKGVNIFSGEQYNILPIRLVNTSKNGAKELLDFLPNSSEFIYKIEHDSGWEVRVHNIDTGEDRIVINLTSERFSDKTFYFKQYLGIIF